MKRTASCAVLAAAAAVGLAGACAAPRRFDGPFAVFPEHAPMAVLAIRDPLERPDFSVEATVRGAGGHEAHLWMMVDSGASTVWVPSATARELGLRDFARGEVEGVAGRQVQTFAVAPSLTIGALTASDVMVGVDTGQNPAILGQSILRRAPWEVSWERGTLTLGATPWREGDEGVQALPLRADGARNMPESVEVRVGGRPVRMLLDTGALTSALPDQLGPALGLEIEPRAVRGYHDFVGQFEVSRVFVADLELGAIRLERQRIFGVSGREQPILGLDVLSRFDFQVIPGQKLLLRRRSDARVSAAARMARWPWLPACAVPGCVGAARVVADGRNGRVEIELEAALPRAARMLFACAEPAGAPSAASDVPTTLATMIDAGPLRGPMRHLLVISGPAPAGALRAEVALAGLLWFARDGSGCHELTLLDVAPAAPGEPPPPAPLANLRP
jgi:predicted aspartyl protease